MGAFILLAYHVEMALQQSHRRSFPAGLPALANHSIANVVMKGFQAQTPRLRQHILARGRLFRRSSRNLGERIKVFPDFFRFEIDEDGHEWRLAPALERV